MIHSTEIPEPSLETTAVPDDRRDLPAIGRDRVGRDLLQDTDDVHFRFIGDAMPFPIVRLSRPVLPQDTNLEEVAHFASACRACHRHVAPSTPRSPWYRPKVLVVRRVLITPSPARAASGPRPGEPARSRPFPMAPPIGFARSTPARSLPLRPIRTIGVAGGSARCRRLRNPTALLSRSTWRWST